MNSIFSINGKCPDVRVTSLKRETSVLDGENAGRLKNGDMERDIIGTFYNYSLTVAAENLDVYDELYELISAPVESYPLTIAFGQRLLSFDAYIANTTDELLYLKNDKTRWHNLSFKITAMEPQRYYGEDWSIDNYMGFPGMGKKIFYLNDQTFDARVKKLDRNSAVLDTSKSGRSISGRMSREIVGTYYNYSMEIVPSMDYDFLHYTLTAPVNSYDMNFVYGQNYLNFKAYITNVSDELIMIKNDEAIWGNMKADFIAMSPARS